MGYVVLSRTTLVPNVRSNLQNVGGDVMVRFLIAALFICHGLVHGLLFGVGAASDEYSVFAVGRPGTVVRSLARGLALLVSTLFIFIGGCIPCASRLVAGRDYMGHDSFPGSP
jgi:hypothetical protein